MPELGGTVKQQQEQTSPNHVQTIILFPVRGCAIAKIRGLRGIFMNEMDIVRVSSG